MISFNSVYPEYPGKSVANSGTILNMRPQSSVLVRNWYESSPALQILFHAYYWNVTTFLSIIVRLFRRFRQAKFQTILTQTKSFVRPAKIAHSTTLLWIHWTQQHEIYAGTKRFHLSWISGIEIYMIRFWEVTKSSYLIHFHEKTSVHFSKDQLNL